MYDYDENRSHLGYCKYCGALVYWVWDILHGRSHWAPPFEPWVRGTPRGIWIKHVCR
jgi:hypothetical protein